jgi:zinc/manganese transport system permease protein
MPADALDPTLTWNVVHDVGELLEYHFMVNALLAGSAVAVAAALVGWLMVLRGEAFAGHTLSMMAFPGAAAAALAGVPGAWGYFLFCSAGAAAIARASGSSRVSWSEQSASIGAVQALALALGFLFVSLYGGVLGDLESLLFGDLLGVGNGQVLLLFVLAAVVVALLAVLARPLVFASLDPDVAAARGVPVRALSLAFLLLLGLTVGATSQVTGALLVFALLVAPAASAQALTARPAASLALTLALALLVVWLGLGIAYFSIYPAGFFVASVAFAVYVLARAIAWARGRGRAGAAYGRGRDAAIEPSPEPRGVIA